MIRQGLWIKTSGLGGTPARPGESAAAGEKAKRTETLLDQDAGQRISTAAAFLSAVPAAGFWSWTSAR